MVGAIGVSVPFFLWSRKWLQGYWYDRVCKAKPDLSGYTALVTGGNSGIGFETALSIAQRGAEVIIACRNQQFAEEAVKDIKRKSNSKKVDFILVDFADLSSVRRCAQNYLDSNKPLHILVNNAGINSKDYKETKDGHEMVWQVNYLGPWLFTHLLLPRFKITAKSSKQRIVFVSSGGHTRATINWENPNGKEEHSGIPAEGSESVLFNHQYGQSKLAQILYAKELQDQFNNEKIPALVVSCTPGGTWTTMVDKFVSWQVKILISTLLYPIVRWYLRSPYMGAQVVNHCCFADDIKGGAYYSNCLEAVPTGKNNIATNPESAKRLWESTEKWLNIHNS